MWYVEAPNEYHKRGYRSVFLGGGITGCPNWQKTMREMLPTGLIQINPRRENFPIGDPNAAWEQIQWEYRHMKRADIILFWFPKETLCPITLYELGKWSMTDKPLVVGVEPGYAREIDVRIQTALERPTVPVVSSLQAVADAVKSWYK